MTRSLRLSPEALLCRLKAAENAVFSGRVWGEAPQTALCYSQKSKGRLSELHNRK